LAFYRQDETIYYWENNLTSQNNLNGTPVFVPIADNPRLVSKILETGLIEFMFGLNNYKISKDGHSHTWQLVSQKDALDGKINGLVVNRRMSISPLFLCPSKNIRYGFTFSNNLKYKFAWDLSIFRQKGIDESRLRIAEDGTTVIPDITTLYHFLGATGQQSYFEQEISKLEKTDETFKIIKDTIDWLDRNKNKIFLPSQIAIKKLHFRYLPIDTIRPETFYSPKRYFYGGTTNTKGLRFYNQMVKEYKPSSFGQFEEKDTQITIVFPAEYEGVTEVFVKTLEKALKEELHLNRLTINLVKINGLRLTDYENGIYSDSEIVKKVTYTFLLLMKNMNVSLLPCLHIIIVRQSF
jgi:hypothetical protein